jgi:hypothetical protein
MARETIAPCRNGLADESHRRQVSWFELFSARRPVKTNRRAGAYRRSSVDADAQRDFMNLALIEGRKALPGCIPNPPVGCVLVREGKVVASGYTLPPGNLHAEAMALSQLSGPLTDVTAFVTLEPCSFHGRTPPAHGHWSRAGSAVCSWRCWIRIRATTERASGFFMRLASKYRSARWKSWPVGI